MCGIVGVIGTASSANKRDVVNYLSQACVTGVLRGDDSTGLFQVSKDNDVNVAKVPLSGRLACDTKSIARVIRDADVSVATVMHHRAATMGSVTYENCHPFEHYMEDKYICGVHNGTLRAWNKREDKLSFDVDSDYLYYTMLRDGPAAALSNCDGSYALVWTEGEDYVYIAANSERSLHWAKVRGDNTILVASEAAMLYWLADRNRLPIEDIQKPAENTIYKISTKDVSVITTIPIPVSSKSYSAYSAWYGSPRTEIVKRDWTLGSRKYGPEAVASAGMAYRQEVDFYSSSEQEDTAEGIFGYLSVNIDGKEEIMEAFIPFPGTVATESIRNSIRCYCRVNGSGKLRVAGEEKDVMLLEHPHRICLAQEDDTKLAEKSMEGPDGKKLTKEQWDKLVSNGCVGCSCALVPDEVVWVNGSAEPLCFNCHEDMKQAFGI